MGEKRKFNVKLTKDEITHIRLVLREYAIMAKGRADAKASNMPAGFRDSVYDTAAFSASQAYETFKNAVTKKKENK